MGSAASNLVDAGNRGSDNPTAATSSVSKPSVVEDSQCIRTRVLIDLVSLPSNVDWKRFASEMVLPAQAVMRWLRDQDQSVSAETGSRTGIVKKATTTTRWDSLRNDLQADIKAVSSGSKKFIESDVFRQSRFGVSKDAELLKEYSVCGHGGLMCAEVSKSPKKGVLVVFNPLTGEMRALPPLLHPRNPVLVHITVDSAKRSYKVIVAGSSAASDEHLSRKVEVFDSSTSKWKEVCDLPGPAFGLNEHQAGVCMNGNLFFISFLEGGGRGVVALDVQNGTWLPDLATPIPWPSSSNTDVQLVGSDEKLFVFSEQQREQWGNRHCIDELEFHQNPKAGVSTCRWRSFVKVKKSGGRGLQVYPEHTCVGFREGKLGFLNWKKLNILLASCIFAIMPTSACAGDPSMDSLSRMWTSNVWDSPDFAKKAAVTLLVGLTMIGARVAWGIFRRRQARGNRFDIMQGLEDSDIPTRGNLVFAIPDIL